MDGFLQLGDSFGLRAAVPESDAEIVAGVGKAGLEGDGSLEVDEGGSQLTLLAQDETEKVVRVRMGVVFTQDFVEELFGSFQIALRCGLQRALVWVIWP